ncbi:MAG: DNRLRE domain-containing protein [Candidatus Latescibacterota bacterium]|nr:DNRLRE domain-containing protein [Candidatus Latescibacterota bacterium]
MYKLVIICFIAVAKTGWPETATIFPSKDNTLYESSAGNLSNGIGFHLFVGTTAGNDIRRCVLHFDLSSLPEGSIVSDAELILYMNRSKAGPNEIKVHRLEADWGEGSSAGTRGQGAGGNATTDDATWLHARYPDSLWQREGGDFIQSPSANQTVTGIGEYRWSSDLLAADVQRWVDSPSENMGWILVGDESTAPTAKRFSSRYNSNSAQRPHLIVDYTSLPANSAPSVQEDLPSQQMAPGQTLSIALAPYFFDADGDTLRFSADIDDPSLATVSVSNDSLFITSLTDSAGSTSILLAVSDGRGGTTSLEFSLYQQITPPQPDLPGDFNGDRVVDFTDFFAFTDVFGTRIGDLQWDPTYDIDGDGDVDFDDFFVFAEYFGQRL